MRLGKKHIRKIFKKISKCIIAVACIFLGIFVVYLAVNDGKIDMPYPMAIALVVIAALVLPCLLIASVIEVYRRLHENGVRALKALLAELIVICGICFVITRRPGSVLNALGVVVGSWGMNYIYRKEE